MKRKVNKKPEHWPNVSPEQQFEGFSFVAKQLKPKELNNTLIFLYCGKYMSQSRKGKYESWYRNINGLSFDDWMTAIEKKGAFRRVK